MLVAEGNTLLMLVAEAIHCSGIIQFHGRNLTDAELSGS